MADLAPNCSSGCVALSKLAGAVETIVATTELRMTRVEDGISDNSAFMIEARAFFTGHNIREQEREKQLNLRDQEIKDALALHNEIENRKLTEVGTKAAKKSMVWTIAGVLVGAASLAAMILFFIIGQWVSHHASTDPLQLLQHYAARQVYTSRVEPDPINAGVKGDRPWQSQ